MKIDAFDFSTTAPLNERLCLDFVNTTPQHINLSDDHLHAYADLISWGHYAGVMDDAEAQRLLDIAVRQPAEAEKALRRAIEVREALYEVLLAAAHEEAPDAQALETYNAALRETVAHLRIEPHGDQFRWGWFDIEGQLNQILWQALWSAAELLTSNERQFLRHCDGHECDWLFLDTSRNHSRRWCDMKTCGNRAKARRHYARARAGE